MKLKSKLRGVRRNDTAETKSHDEFELEASSKGFNFVK